MTSRTPILLYAAAIAIAVAGYLIDRRFGHDVFARSGALIVALGAATAGREIYLGERAIARTEARVEKLEAAYLDAAREGGAATPEAFTRLAEILANFREARLQHVGKMIYTEITIVCIGTLIWGFGDLAV